MNITGQYMLKGNISNSCELMCVTMTDPAMVILEIEEIFAIVSVNIKGMANVITDKTSKIMVIKSIYTLLNSQSI